MKKENKVTLLTVENGKQRMRDSVLLDKNSEWRMKIKYPYSKLRMANRE